MPKQTREEKNILINRFNRPIEDDNFIESFQEIMIERLLLNRDRKYHPKNLEQIIKGSRWKGERKNSRNTRLDISGGFLLSTTVEADFYILLQELIKDMTGNYMPMDEFLNLLLSWFYQYYAGGRTNKEKLPFKKINRKNKKRKIKQFNKQFSKFY